MWIPVLSSGPGQRPEAPFRHRHGAVFGARRQRQPAGFLAVVFPDQPSGKPAARRRTRRPSFRPGYRGERHRSLLHPR